MMGTLGTITSMGSSPDHILALEKELDSLKTQLQVRTWLLAKFFILNLLIL